MNKYDCQKLAIIKPPLARVEKIVSKLYTLKAHIFLMKVSFQPGAYWTTLTLPDSSVYWTIALVPLTYKLTSFDLDVQFQNANRNIRFYVIVQLDMFFKFLCGSIAKQNLYVVNQITSIWNKSSWNGGYTIFIKFWANSPF